MKKPIAKVLSALLLVCMILSLAVSSAFAAESQTEPAQDPGLLADVLGVMDSAYVGRNIKLYVKPDQDAGLPSKVKVKFHYNDLNGAVYFPGTTKNKQFYFSWNDPDLVVLKDGKELKNGKAPVAPFGEKVTYQVVKDGLSSFVTIESCRGSVGVEPMFITLDEKKGTIKAMNNDPDHESKCYGKVLFDGKNKYVSMKGRGNSTWVFPKKPYNLTFYHDPEFSDKDSVKLIKGVKAKNWSLVANHLDNSLLRNKIAFDLAVNMGIGLQSKFVDVWVNGQYYGNYLLTPKNDFDTPDNGYQLENDNYIDPGNSFQLPGMFEIGTIPGVTILGSGYNNRICLKDMGDTAKANGENLKTIEKYFNKAWTALLDYDSEEYQNYFDIDSWSKMYLMYEVTKTYDCYAGSLLMHRDGLSKNDKLIAGPAWDYDISLGRTLHKFFVGVSIHMQMNAEGWYNDHIGADLSDQPISLLQELGKHKSFRDQVAKTFNKYEWAFNDMTANVDRQMKVIRDSVVMNNERWLTNNLCADYLVAPNTMSSIGTGKYKLNYHITTTWSDYCYNLKEFCNKRVLWLSDHT